MESMIEGKTRPVRRKGSWLKNVSDWTGMDKQSLLRSAEDREQFARIIGNLQ